MCWKLKIQTSIPSLNRESCWRPYAATNYEESLLAYSYELTGKVSSSADGQLAGARVRIKGSTAGVLKMSVLLPK